jgi:hypothetical protein
MKPLKASNDAVNFARIPLLQPTGLAVTLQSFAVWRFHEPTVSARSSRSNPALLHRAYEALAKSHCENSAVC